MKYIVFVGDGMADYMMEELDGKTPLQVANTPTLDLLASSGIIGKANFLYTGLIYGSDVALMSILGYSPLEYYPGRAVLEARGRDIDQTEGYFFRANLVTISSEKLLISHSAGGISTEEAKILINFLNEKLSQDYNLVFYPGVGYRHILHFKDKDLDFSQVECSPPHDIINQNFRENLPRNKNKKAVSLLKEIMLKSALLLEKHPINERRRHKANMIWLWGQAQADVRLKQFGLKGIVIAAVDLIKGLGKVIGFDAYTPPGATGGLDTDYSAKARAAIESLSKYDFILVHLEAPDEASHNADIKSKIQAITKFDTELVKPVFEYLNKTKTDYQILVLTDHLTPIYERTHKPGFVPFVIFNSKKHKINNKITLTYDEVTIIKDSSLIFEEGHKLMDYFLKSKFND